MFDTGIPPSNKEAIKQGAEHSSPIEMPEGFITNLLLLPFWMYVLRVNTVILNHREKLEDNKEGLYFKLLIQI